MADRRPNVRLSLPVLSFALMRFFFLVSCLLLSYPSSDGEFLEVGKSRVVEWIWFLQTSVNY